MKNSITIWIAALLVVVLSSSCKNDDSGSSPSVSGTITQGSWKVTLYSDNGNDETSHFSGYVFTFSSNGTVTAVRSGSSVSGAWSDGNDDSQTKLVLTFLSPPDFEEISDDWHVLKNTSSKIELEDVSGGNGGTDLLTFEKN